MRLRKGGTWWCPRGRRLCGSRATPSSSASAWPHSHGRRRASRPAGRRCPRRTTRRAGSRRRLRRSPPLRPPGWLRERPSRPRRFRHPTRRSSWRRLRRSPQRSTSPRARPRHRHRIPLRPQPRRRSGLDPSSRRCLPPGRSSPAPHPAAKPKPATKPVRRRQDEEVHEGRCEAARASAASAREQAEGRGPDRAPRRGLRAARPRRRPERSPARNGRDPPRRGGLRQHRPRRRGAQRDEAGMRSLRALCAVLAVAAGCAALPGAAAALDPPSASCNGGGCGGWFRSSVTVSWSFNSSGATGTSGCGAATVSDDTGGATFTCTVNYGGSFVGSSVTVRKDSSPPGVEASASPRPRHERLVHEPGQLQLHRRRRRLGGRVVHVGHIQRPRRRRHHRLGVVYGQRRQHRVDVVEDQVRRDAPHRRRHPCAEARCERVVQPSGRRRVHRHGRRLGRLRVLADGDATRARTPIRQSSSASAATPPAT